MKRHGRLWLAYAATLAAVGLLVSPALPPPPAYVAGILERAAFYAALITAVQFVLRKTGRL